MNLFKWDWIKITYNKSIIVSAFPACGKSFTTKYLSMHKGFNVTDSDSSKYSWIYDELGNKTNERNPNFIEDYLNHIKEESLVRDFIFISAHDNVRKALINEKIPYCLVYPDISMKETMLARMKERGNDESFIKFQEENFESFINEINSIEGAYNLCKRFKLTKKKPFLDVELLEYMKSFPYRIITEDN